VLLETQPGVKMAKNSLGASIFKPYAIWARTQPESEVVF